MLSAGRSGILPPRPCRIHCRIQFICWQNRAVPDQRRIQNRIRAGPRTAPEPEPRQNHSRSGPELDPNWTRSCYILMDSIGCWWILADSDGFLFSLLYSPSCCQPLCKISRWWRASNSTIQAMTVDRLLRMLGQVRFTLPACFLVLLVVLLRIHETKNTTYEKQDSVAL